MGYTISIGEAYLDWDESIVGIDVIPVKLDYAPAFGEPTDYTNSRWPSYTAWADMCRELDIYELMFGAEDSWYFEYKGEEIPALLPDHPGVAPLTPIVLEYLQEKISAYKTANPTHIAQYPPLKEGIEKHRIHAMLEDFVDDPRYDGNLCRAEWLLFWVRWAIENCEKPVFVNS